VTNRPTTDQPTTNSVTDPTSDGCHTTTHLPHLRTTSQPFDVGAIDT